MSEFAFTFAGVLLRPRCTQLLLADAIFHGTKLGNGGIFGKLAEYCFEGTVSEERERELAEFCDKLGEFALARK